MLTAEGPISTWTVRLYWIAIQLQHWSVPPHWVCMFFWKRGNGPGWYAARDLFRAFHEE